MAVVFISPKKRQRAFFAIITLMFLLFLALISVGVFLAKPAQVSPTVVFNKAKINIDMSIFDSERFKNLQAVSIMGFQYSYKASAKNGKQVEGFISAKSADDAKQVLQGMGFTMNYLKEIGPGRDNPFIPYYTVVVTPTVPIVPVTPAVPVAPSTPATPTP